MEPMTLREIAMHEGVSHQCVAEILARALKKFRAGLAARGIQIEDLI